MKKRGEGYKVTTPNHPQGFSKKPLSKEKAKKQLAAIHMHTNESFERRLQLVLEGMDLYSARESIKNALAHLLTDPQMLVQTLNLARDQVQGNEMAMAIVSNISNYAARYIQKIRGLGIQVYERGRHAPRMPRPGERGFDQLRALYDQFSEPMYNIWSGFDKIGQRLDEAVSHVFDNDEHERQSDLEFTARKQKEEAEKKVANRQRRVSAADQRDELRAEKRLAR